MTSDDSSRDYLLYLQTVQGTAFKTLFEVLKEILHDVNVVFDDTGMKVVTMDGAHVSLIHLKLEAGNFEKYVCKRKLGIGMNMLSMYKLIKSVNTHDTIVLYIDEDSCAELGIRIENPEKNAVTDFKLKLLDIDSEHLIIPDVEFQSVITMPSAFFQRICRDMLNLSEVITIRSHRDTFVLSCEGDFAKQETVIGEKTDGMTMCTKTDEVVEGKYSLKYLNLFTKSTSLCNTIELFVKQDYPLILQYNVANLGSIRFCLAPKNDDD